MVKNPYSSGTITIDLGMFQGFSYYVDTAALDYCSNVTYSTAPYPPLSTGVRLPDCATSAKIAGKVDEQPMNEKTMLRIGEWYEGQRVSVKNNCSGCKAGDICILKNHSGDLFAVPEGWDEDQEKDIGGCSCSFNWCVEVQVMKVKEETMSQVSPMAENLLDADTKALVEAGMVDECLNLTSKGRDALQALVFVAHKEAMVKQAKAEIKEAKSKK